jgi:dTDP-4-dehydrorhamnose 3,5-epimerase
VPFTFQRLALPDVVLVTPKVFEDARGFFMEAYKRSDFAAQGIAESFVQDNYSHSSSRGVLRGLHYQKAPRPQGKLVCVLRGAIFDVAVDIRRGSPTYGQWVGVELRDDVRQMLWVPPGFAHGFCVLSDGADVLYKCTEEYAPELDRALRWDDPEIGVRWPVKDPLLSAKDAAAPLLRDADINYVYPEVQA